MEKFIQPRGTGRTYNICKYAIENDCNIVANTFNNVIQCEHVVEDICRDSHDKYVYCKFKRQPVYTAIIFRRDQEDLIEVKFWDISQYIKENQYVDSRKNIVIDDIDACMQAVFNNIKAASIESYDPADVALKGGVSAD